MVERKQEELEQLATLLAKQTGITCDQACDLIRLLGTEWSSLMREARLLKNQR